MINWCCKLLFLIVETVMKVFCAAADKNYGKDKPQDETSNKKPFGTSCSE
jgi:hypothetical protein